MPHSNVIEQHKMLVDLAHIADMRNYRQAELTCEQADGEEFRNPRNPCAIYLHKMNRPRLHEVLEHDAIWNVLAQRDRDGRDCLGQSSGAPEYRPGGWAPR